MMRLEIYDPNETRFERFKRRAKAKVHDTLKWLSENKETVILLTPVAIGGLKVITTVVKAVGKRINLNQAEAVKNMYCYDPSLGHYWALKRELTSSEWLSVDRRRKNGERLSEIFEEMKVLK